jgi:hypothetical protein
VKSCRNESDASEDLAFGVEGAKLGLDTGLGSTDDKLTLDGGDELTFATIKGRSSKGDEAEAAAGFGVRRHVSLFTEGFAGGPRITSLIDRRAGAVIWTNRFK